MSSKLKLFFIITDFGSSHKLKKCLDAEKVRFLVNFVGGGSADSVVFDLLGLGENKKVVSLALVDDGQTKPLYRRLDNDLQIRERGRGIAFSVQISAASAALCAFYGLEDFKSAEEKAKLPAQLYFRRRREDIEMQTPFELLITVVNLGSWEKVKSAAKTAGARGGTVIHGLGTGGEEAAKFLGISIQQEKDLVLIVTPKKDRDRIMQAIIDAAGLATESRGICFSVPVESAAGLIVDPE